MDWRLRRRLQYAKHPRGCQAGPNAMKPSRSWQPTKNWLPPHPPTNPAIASDQFNRASEVAKPALLGQHNTPIPSMPGHSIDPSAPGIPTVDVFNQFVEPATTQICTSFKTIDRFDAQSRSLARERSSWMQHLDLSHTPGHRSSDPIRQTTGQSCSGCGTTSDR